MELYIPPKKRDRNPVNGRFLKGNTPFTNGKKWEDYMSEEKIKELREKVADSMRKNRVHNPKKKVPVICVDKDGSCRYYEGMKEAADSIGSSAGNVWNVCHGIRKTTKGYRLFLFESNEWIKLIK